MNITSKTFVIIRKILYYNKNFVAIEKNYIITKRIVTVRKIIISQQNGLLQ